MNKFIFKSLCLSFIFFYTLEAMEDNYLEKQKNYGFHESRLNYIESLLKIGTQKPTDITNQTKNDLRKRKLSMKDSYKFPIEEEKKRLYEGHFDFFKNERNPENTEHSDFLKKYLCRYTFQINEEYKTRENDLVRESHVINNQKESISIEDAIISLNSVLSYNDSNNESSENKKEEEQKERFEKYFEAIKNNLPEKSENYNNREENKSNNLFGSIIESMQEDLKNMPENFKKKKYQWIQTVYPELYEIENIEKKK